MKPSIHDILGMLEQVKEAGVDQKTGQDRYYCCCPHPDHDDQHPSCTVLLDRDKGYSTFLCHRGCSNEEIKRHLGLWEDSGDGVQAASYPKPKPKKKSKKKTKKKPKKKLVREDPALIHNYYLRDGTLSFTVKRIKQYFDDGSTNKHMPTSYVDEDGNTQHTLVGREKPFYRMLELAAQRPIRNLWWHEGEHKADLCAEKYNVPSTSINGGANAKISATVKKDIVWLGVRVVHYVMDNDEAGYIFAKRVMDFCHELGIIVRLYRAAVDTPKADIVDHAEAGFDLSQLTPVDVPRPADLGEENELSRFLVSQARGELMFVAQEAKDFKWHVYQKGIFRAGHHFAKEYVLRLFEDRRDELQMDNVQQSQSRRLQDACTRNGISAALSLSEARLYCDMNQFGQHVYTTLLPTKNCVVDLKTGNPLPHHPKYRFTMQCPTEYHPNAQCPEWESLVETWIPDPELRAWLQCLIGSAACGLTDQICAQFYGFGANGKSTFLRVIASVLGDSGLEGFVAYTDINTWLDTGKQRSGADHRADLDDLRGRRLVLASEPNKNAKLNINIVNEWTGGEPMKARAVGAAKMWPFTPQGLLIFQANNTLRIENDSYGIWRRMQLVPWEVQIPASERRNHLDRELVKKEAEGILRWIVNGAQAYLSMGSLFPVPAIVEEASKVYRQDEDQLGVFLRSTTKEDEGSTVLVADLWARYAVWAEKNHDKPLKKIGLSKELKARGWKQKRISGGAYVWDDRAFKSSTEEHADE